MEVPAHPFPPRGGRWLQAPPRLELIQDSLDLRPNLEESAFVIKAGNPTQPSKHSRSDGDPSRQAQNGRPHRSDGQTRTDSSPCSTPQPTYDAEAT